MTSMVSTVRARTLVLAAGLFPALAAACSGSHSVQDPTTPARQVHVRAPEKESRPTPLHELSTGALTAPVQDAAAAGLGGNRVLLLGGLNSADASTDTVALVSGRHASLVGRLPVALHDSAAVSLGRNVYLFGGGDGVRQLDAILRVDPRSGASAPAGRLPAPSSDQSAAAIGQTAYVVGGYTGTSWLDTIVAYRPGAGARVVGRLPTPVRYAAVAAADGRLVIAGGSLPNGTASSAVFSFEPSTGSVTRLGKLPAPTTHAAAAVVGDDVFVIGGRGAASDTPTDRIVEVERSGHVRLSGHLLAARSDAAAVALGNSILVAGGRVAGSPTANVGKLVVGRAKVHALGRTGVPAAIDRSNVYAADGPGMLSSVVRHDPPYVPNSQSATVDVVDQRTFRIVRHFAVGLLPQHVVPSYDLKTLYVTNDVGNSLTPINPRTGEPGKQIPVDDPYNMYFTPDGRYAIVVAERNQRLDFRDAHTFVLHHSLDVPECRGVDHVDFSADGSYFVASCEFSGRMIKVEVQSERVVGEMTLNGGDAMPQDVKLSPDGKVFYVADQRAGGVWELTGEPFRKIGFLPTGAGAHGLYPSRDARYLYVTNRGEGSISIVSFRTRRVAAKWRLPGGGSPDMGGVSADGKVLWLTGRYNGVLYAISTRNGRLLATIPVGGGPHGACVWPQPGRYSLGHTGILR